VIFIALNQLFKTSFRIMEKDPAQRSRAHAAILNSAATPAGVAWQVLDSQ
jgi:hypothetical protein